MSFFSLFQIFIWESSFRMSQFSSFNKNKANRYNSDSGKGQRENKSGQRAERSGNSDSYRYNQNQPPPASFSNSQQRRTNDAKTAPRVNPSISSLKAECMQMCSQEERQMRIYNKLVNPLEMKKTE